MVDILREAKADVEWWCDVSDGRYFGPVRVTLQVHDEWSYIPTQNLGEWAIDAIDTLLEEVCTNSCAVFGDSVWCGDHSVIRGPYDVKQTPPTISPAVRGNIEVILQKIKENADDIEYVNDLNRELDSLLERNDLTRDDIRDLM